MARWTAASVALVLLSLLGLSAFAVADSRGASGGKAAAAHDAASVPFGSEAGFARGHLGEQVLLSSGGGGGAGGDHGGGGGARDFSTNPTPGSLSGSGGQRSSQGGGGSTSSGASGASGASGSSSSGFHDSFEQSGLLRGGIGGGGAGGDHADSEGANAETREALTSVGALYKLQSVVTHSLKPRLVTYNP
jgi:hypothetical protein